LFINVNLTEIFTVHRFKVSHHHRHQQMRWKMFHFLQKSEQKNFLIFVSDLFHLIGCVNISSVAPTQPTIAKNIEKVFRGICKHFSSTKKPFKVNFKSFALILCVCDDDEHSLDQFFWTLHGQIIHSQTPHWGGLAFHKFIVRALISFVIDKFSELKPENGDQNNCFAFVMSKAQVHTCMWDVRNVNFILNCVWALLAACKLD